MHEPIRPDDHRLNKGEGRLHESRSPSMSSLSLKPIERTFTIAAVAASSTHLPFFTTAPSSASLFWIADVRKLRCPVSTYLLQPLRSYS